MKILVLILVIVAGAVVFFDVPQKIRNPFESVGRISTESEVAQMDRVDVGEKSFGYSHFVVGNPENLNLIANFSQELSSSEAVEKYKCESLINGGFYSKSNEPIGWFKTENRVHSMPETNSLFNGFLSVNKAGTAAISLVYPGPSVRIGLQTGPLLVAGGSARSLRIKNDEARRRSVAMVTDEGGLIFVIISAVDSELTGPTLEELPQVALAIGKELGANVAEAINLDGGLAAAFVSESVALSEVSVVGSFFCDPKI